MRVIIAERIFHEIQCSTCVATGTIQRECFTTCFLLHAAKSRVKPSQVERLLGWAKLGMIWMGNSLTCYEFYYELWRQMSCLGRASPEKGFTIASIFAEVCPKTAPMNLTQTPRMLMIIWFWARTCFVPSDKEHPASRCHALGIEIYRYSICWGAINKVAGTWKFLEKVETT